MQNANLPCHADLVVSSSPANASSPFPDDDPTRRLATLLTGIYTVAETPETSETLTHLDTADWRLRGAGIDLIWTVGTRELIAFGPDDRTTVQLLGAARWPALIDKIPEGAVRDLVARPVSIRALLPFAVTRARSTGFAVLNSDDKTVARARWWDVRVESPVERRLPARVEVEHFRGYEDEAGEIEHLLTAGSTLSRATGTWLDAFRAVPGIGPAKTQRFGMHADQAADLAVADALLGHLSIMEATVDGIIADLDTEFLHDFRVSVRRTRSVLKLLGDVLPEGTAAKTAVEFRWLGDATTPTRDLDVYLLGFDELAASVSRPHDLQPFADHLRRRRAAAQRGLVRALRSARFANLVRSWRAELAATIAAPQHSGQTAAKLADLRLHRTFRKVTKRARRIHAESPSEEIHALRKACKEMRYLLDVFRPLCDPKAYRLVVSDFKQLQDILGEFQDGEVQAEALHRFAHEMITGRFPQANAILAMGELSGQFESRQRAARNTLTAHHDEYLGKRVAAHVDRLIPADQKTGSSV